MAKQKKKVRFGHNFISSVVLLLTGLCILFVSSTVIIFQVEKNSAQEKSGILTERVADAVKSELSHINDLSMSLFLTNSFQKEVKDLRGNDPTTMENIVTYFETMSITDGDLVKNVLYVPYDNEGNADLDYLVNYGSDYSIVENNIDRIVALASEEPVSDGSLFCTSLYYRTGELVSSLAFVRVVRGITVDAFYEKLGIGIMCVYGDYLKAALDYATVLDGFEIAVWDDSSRNVAERETSVIFSSDDSFSVEVLEDEKYYAKTYVANSFIPWKITGYYNINSVFRSSLSTLLIYSAIFFLACGILSVLSILIYRRSIKAYNYLYEQFSDRQNLFDGSFGQIEYTKDEQVNKVIKSFNEMSAFVSELNVLVREKEKEALSLQLESARFRLESLYSQINKHFLINVLSSARSLIRLGEREQANYCLENLSIFLRKILTVQDVSTIRQEIEILDSYMNIQRLRYPKVKCEISCEEALLGYSIPKMILQPIVENVYEHGLKRKRGELRIVFRRRKNWLTIFVGDNGAGLEKAREKEVNDSLRNLKPLIEATEKTNGIALLNIQRRLLLVAGEKSCVRIRSPKGYGAVTMVKIAFKDRTEAKE